MKGSEVQYILTEPNKVKICNSDNTWEFLFEYNPLSYVTDYFGNIGYCLKCVTANYKGFTDDGEYINNLDFGPTYLGDERLLTMSKDFELLQYGHHYSKGAPVPSYVRLRKTGLFTTHFEIIPEVERLKELAKHCETTVEKFIAEKYAFRSMFKSVKDEIEAN